MPSRRAPRARTIGLAVVAAAASPASLSIASAEEVDERPGDEPERRRPSPPPRSNASVGQIEGDRADQNTGPERKHVGDQRDCPGGRTKRDQRAEHEREPADQSPGRSGLEQRPECDGSGGWTDRAGRRVWKRIKEKVMTETIKQAKLVQYLSEAYSKEKELETALKAHIGVTTRKPYESVSGSPQGDEGARERPRAADQEVGGGGPQLADKVPGPRREGEVARQGAAPRVRGTARPRRCSRTRRPVLERARGDRQLHGDRDPRRERRRRRHREARAGDPPRRGADGEVPGDAGIARC